MMGPVLAGYIFDYTGSYRWAGIMCGIPLLIAQCFLVMMFVQVKREGKLKISDFGAPRSVSDGDRSSSSSSDHLVADKLVAKVDTEKTKLLRSVVSVSSNT